MARKCVGQEQNDHEWHAARRPVNQFSRQPAGLGRLCQGHLHHHGRDDAFDARCRSRGRPRGLHARGRGVRKAVPDAGFLPDLRPVSRPRDRSRLAHLYRSQGRSFRLLLRLVGDDPVRDQGAGVRRRARLARCRQDVSARVHRTVRHVVVYLPAADLLRRHKTDTARSCRGHLHRRRGAGDGQNPHRLDRDRRIRRALRLLLCGLPAGPLHLHLRTRRAGPRRASRSSASPCGR